jgi:hypothetical protein
MSVPSHTRTPRQPRPWPHTTPDGKSSEDGNVLIGLATIVTLAAFFGTTAYQAHLYGVAGVQDVQWAGAVAAQLAVVGSLYSAATLWRWGHPMASVYVAGAVGGVLAVALAVLPHIAAGRGWLTTILGSVFCLSAVVTAALWLTMAAIYMPNWWSGWHRDVPSEGFEPPTS